MRLKPRTVFRIILVIILVALFVRNYWLQRDVDRARDSRPTVSRSDAPAKSRDLSRDDLLGGHTLSRHVAKTDDDLRQRLQAERINAASTYSDRATAQSAIAEALNRNRTRIDEWLARRSHPNLALDYEADRPLGRTLLRGATSSTPCSRATVVLKHVASAGANLPRDDSFFVLTSYPDC